MENQNLSNKNKIKMVGIVILGVSAALFLVQYFGVIKGEISYLLRDKNESREVTLAEAPAESKDKKTIVANNKDFALVIPKIGVNTKIIPNIDPFNSKEYQKALSQGVAHAIGTSTPTEGKNTVIFAHSTDNFYNANRYNAIFYLLSKLSKEDEVFVVQESKIYKYSVLANLVTEADEIGFMEQDMEDTLTLITCWPPGTTLKRRVVVAQLVK